MNSRVDKYYENNTEVGSRTKKNQELYKEISKQELENYEIKSNATVLGNNEPSIDVDRIKSILDTHYNDTPARKTIKLEREERDIPKVDSDVETKEYDINVILDKAKEEKETSYEEDKNSKLSDTNYEILKNLNIDKKEYIENYDGDEDDGEYSSNTLEDLINTITSNETISHTEEDEEDDNTDTISEEKDEDLFADLKADDEEDVLESQSQEIDTVEDKEEKDTKTDNSFFTKTDSFRKKDFEDYEEIEEDEKGVSWFTKSLIILLAIAFIIGIVLLVKSFL